ncbi:MAG: pyridoxamine 5'-phosphate oxidase family protein [Acidobacteria bacterium]|nr:pyridoxamine 5'-phosphate oxidase family protein [Acidobacteriota bacterium]
MPKNFAEIAFTESVKAQQEKYGSRRSYARMEAQARGTELSFAETDFIAERDSFYLSTVGENGYPYVQFRGGPKGFLKVLDARTLAYADFRGNMQYVSVGNLARNDKGAIILMDYAQRRRLKIYARIEVIEAADAPELIPQLQDQGYTAQIERAMLLHLEAFDWNCPQHITQRFTIEEIRELNASLYEHVARLEAELERMKAIVNIHQSLKGP